MNMAARWRQFREGLLDCLTSVLQRIQTIVKRLTGTTVKPTFNAEYLRPLRNVLDVDPRNSLFVKLDRASRSFRPLELADYHKAISELSLHGGVPENVVVQFETAKNLYLYAWFVYRFYPVSEHQSLTCLEFALRERFERDIPKGYFRGEKPTLKPLLRYAVDSGHIRNDGFRRWHERVQMRARQRYEWEKAKEMDTKGLDSIILDESEVIVTEQDRDWNYLNIVLEVLPEIRNEYAHGTPSLHNQVRGTIELVAEIIKQIYPSKELL